MGLTDVWNDIDFYEEVRYHPTQKPIKLIERLIYASSNEGDVVLDPFMGAGSTLIASRNLNRECIGFELDPHYCSVSNSRGQGKKALTLKKSKQATKKYNNNSPSIFDNEPFE